MDPSLSELRHAVFNKHKLLLTDAEVAHKLINSSTGPTLKEIDDCLLYYPEIANGVDAEQAVELCNLYAAKQRAEAAAAVERKAWEEEQIRTHGSLPWGYGWT